MLTTLLHFPLCHHPLALHLHLLTLTALLCLHVVIMLFPLHEGLRHVTHIILCLPPPLPAY